MRTQLSHTVKGKKPQLLRVAHRCACALSIDVLGLVRGLIGVPQFIHTALQYRRQWDGRDAFQLQIRDLYPCLGEWRESAGQARGHYFHQDLWAARKIFEATPNVHVDIGSRIDGFVAHLLCFMSVTVIDIRPLRSDVKGLTFVQDDATTLATFGESTVESLSSLHAVEHFGLGRYGDPVDPDAPYAAMRNLARILKPGGTLYFALPIGIERLEFNGQRIFDPNSIMRAFPTLRLVSFSAVDDTGDLITPAEPEDFKRARNACGLYEFTK